MPWTQTALAVGIVLFIILLVWSRVQGQTMLDTVKEIRDIVMLLFEND